MSSVPLPVAISLSSPMLRYTHPVKETVTNIGRDSVRVTTRTVTLHAACKESPVVGVQVSPDGFLLPPGHSTTVTITVPKGQADYGVVFNASRVTSHGTTAGPGIGVQVVTGHAALCVHPRPHGVAYKPTSAGVPFGWMAGGVLIALVVLLAVLAVFLRRRRYPKVR